MLDKVLPVYMMHVHVVKNITNMVFGNVFAKAATHG
jgi:hypothetical protein